MRVGSHLALNAAVLCHARVLAAVWPNRVAKPLTPQRRAMIGRGLSVLARLLWHVGIRGEGDYRGAFWRFALPLLRRGRLEPLLHYALMAHHLIVFAREATAGRLNASHYATKLQERAPMLEPAE